MHGGHNEHLKWLLSDTLEFPEEREEIVRGEKLPVNTVEGSKSGCDNVELPYPDLSNRNDDDDDVRVRSLMAASPSAREQMRPFASVWTRTKKIIADVNTSTMKIRKGAVPLTIRLPRENSAVVRLKFVRMTVALS